VKSFEHLNYHVFPAGQQLQSGKWMALASLIRWQGEEMLVMPVSWYPPEFDTEQAAVAHAAASAKDMIDAGRCRL
jgi:hypothetical protein